MQFRIRVFRMLEIRMGSLLFRELQIKMGMVMLWHHAEGNANGNNGNQIRCYNCIVNSHLLRNSHQAKEKGVCISSNSFADCSKRRSRIQLQAEEFDLMAAATDLDKIEEVNANCILMANLQQASTSGTQTDKAPVYDSDRLAEIQKIVKDEIFPIVNQVDARVQNFKIQFLKEAAKFVQAFKSLAKESDESLAKHKDLEFEIKRLLRAVVSQDIISIVQNPTVVEISDLQIELERMKELFENCIIKKENEYAKLWNDWYKKYEECKYDKISYDKAYNDMQQKIERLQAQLGDLKGVDTTAKTRRPQPRSNTKNDRVPSTSKSSCSKNNEVEVEEHPRNLLLSKNKKHMSSECNNVIFDTRPPILDRTDFASWQQRSRLYCRGKENEVNILKSINEGPFQMGTFWETLAEGNEGALHLGPEDKERFESILTFHLKIRNGITLTSEQQISYFKGYQKTSTLSSIITLMQKTFGDNVKMLLEGSELTKEDPHQRYAKHQDDNVQNAVEFQLYAYLKQHEAHANKNKMMLDRFTQHTVDSLALMSNVSHQQYYSQSSTTPASTYVPPHFADNSQLDSGLSPTDNLIENLTNTLALLTQSYKTYLPQTNNQLRTSSNTRNQATVIRTARVGNANPGQARQIKCYNGNGICHIARNCTQPKRPQNSEYFKDKILLMQAQENGVALDEEQLLFIAADDCDAFDSDVDEAPTAHTMFMANLSSADLVYDEASPSYDMDILSEVHDDDHYQDVVCAHHEVHDMHDDVQPNFIVDSHADYTSDSNMIPYDQYVKDNAVPVVQSNVSSVPNDAYMMIFNDIYEPSAQYVFVTTQNNIVDNLLTIELATYKEQVELYERRARFELTEREQKINEQLRIVITDRNIKEENLKKELHSVKMQLASTINHNKSMVEEVTSLKKDFKQKENEYLEEFLDMKALKEKIAIRYKNPLCLTCAKKVQPALYNGYEIIKNNHVPALVHNTEDTLEIAEITRRKMNDKMKDHECVTNKVKIASPAYSKENYLATFTPQKQLTPKQICWSQDLIKMKEEALKKQTTTSRPIKALMALTKEIKEMKDIFEDLEAQVDQNVVNRKHDEIEQKNLLISNDNLIVDCLSKEVFYIAMNSEIIVSRFTKMHEVHTIVQTRCLELEAELSKL
ncbi:hypothetical protein Tco_0961679 [Tanacetum coccineum]